MTRKIIGYYTNALDDAYNGQLILEIGDTELVCIARQEGAQRPDGLEVFGIGKDENDWRGLFAGIASESRLLGRSYRSTVCFYNCEEALIMPSANFSTSAAEDHLSLVFGDKKGFDVKHEPVTDQPMVTAYRIPASIHDLVGHQFVLYKPRHIYTAMLEEALRKQPMPVHFIKLRFYGSHFALVYLHDGKLQLLRSFGYSTAEDILYHLISISQQFHIVPAEATLEIGGMLDAESVSQRQLQQLFAEISFDTVLQDEAFLNGVSIYPSYYFTPFYKLPA